MQATSATYRPVTETGWLTTSSLILIVVLALVTLGAIAYGMRLSAKRRHAQRAEEQRVQAEAPAAAEPTASGPPADAAEPAPIAVARAAEALPVAPEPPPLGSGPAPGTPAADPIPAAPDVADEPVAAAAPFDASPAVEAEAAASEPPRTDAADWPLTRLKGLGPKVAARLEELGVARVGELAALSEAEAAAVDARLGPFTGRMARDRWLEQARLLSAGDDRAFEATFGKL